MKIHRALIIAINLRIENGIKVRYYEQRSSAFEQVRGFRSREMRCSSDDREKNHSKTTKVKVERREAYRR